MEPIEARAYFPEVSQEMIEMIASGEFKVNDFDFAAEKYTSEFAQKVKSLPRVEMTARPLKVPKILVDLPRDSEVIVRDGRGDSVEQAWQALSSIERQIQRQARGFFEMKEVAEILANSCTSANGRPITPAEFDKDLTRAFFSGELPFFNERLTQMDFKNEKETFNFGWYGETTTPEAVNAWLEATGSPHRFPILKAEEAAAPLVKPTDEVDYSLLATPDKLIEAFGKSTGMDASWFDNLTDTPKLFAARKVTGTGGKHYTSPLFCPFEVMQWLIDGKRKKGRKVSLEKAWQLLQSNFEKVYNTRSAGDPR